MKRALRIGLVVLAAFELLYVLVANVALSFDLIPAAVARATPKVKLKWDRAWTLIPGRVSVSGYRMQFEDDHTVQFDLSVEHSTASISLLPLLRRRIAIDHVRATGVSYRMSTKVSAATAESSPRRVAAFPRVEPFAFPPIKPDVAPTPLTPEQIDRLISVELTDIEADILELWVDEYRYVGPAHVKGAFGLEPLKKLWVGPATMAFAGGKLTAGDHVLLPAFVAGVELTLAPLSLGGAAPGSMLAGLNGRVRTATQVEDLGVVELYLDSVTAAGGGTLTLDLKLHEGRVTRDSTASLNLERLEASGSGFKFTGTAALGLAVTDENKLRAEATVPGTLVTPPLVELPLHLAVTGATAELMLDSNDLGAPPGLERLTARVTEARADDARPITKVAAKYVPVIAPAVLGDGPLTSSLTVTVTPEYALLRLKQSNLGDANLSGAMLHNEKGWNGAAAGNFGKLTLGLLVTDGQFGYRPFISMGWLDEETDKAGIARVLQHADRSGSAP